MDAHENVSHVPSRRRRRMIVAVTLTIGAGCFSLPVDVADPSMAPPFEVDAMLSPLVLMGR